MRKVKPPSWATCAGSEHLEVCPLCLRELIDEVGVSDDRVRDMLRKAGPWVVIVCFFVRLCPHCEGDGRAACACTGLGFVAPRDLWMDQSAGGRIAR